MAVESAQRTIVNEGRKKCSFLKRVPEEDRTSGTHLGKSTARGIAIRNGEENPEQV